MLADGQGVRQRLVEVAERIRDAEWMSTARSASRQLARDRFDRDLLFDRFEQVLLRAERQRGGDEHGSRACLGDQAGEPVGGPAQRDGAGDGEDEQARGDRQRGAPGAGEQPHALLLRRQRNAATAGVLEHQQCVLRPL